jgi:hypothetical protein
MNIPRTSLNTVIAVAALLLLGARMAVTQPFETGVTRATVCVKSSGQMRMSPSGPSGCGPSEQPVRWVVDGEVTDVRVGDGLVASRESGLVNIELDPSILECEKCNDGKVFAGFNDGPAEIPAGEPPAHHPAQIAKLDLPEGSYAIFAKMQLVNHTENSDAFVRCKLTAGADSDEAEIILELPTTKPGQWGGATLDVMKLQVVHRFDAPGAVILSCADGYSLPDLLGGGAFDGPAEFTHLKIIAMKVSSISNVVLWN